MVRLERITKQNLDEVLSLKVNDSQAGFVSTTAESLAQAYAYTDTAFPFAVCDGQTVVGFIMMGYYEEKKYYTLWKLMIDRKYQGRGYGKAALKLGIAFLEERFQAAEVFTGVIPGNKAAKGLYRSVGFEETGLFENGMEEMCLKCFGRRCEKMDQQIVSFLIKAKQVTYAGKGAETTPSRTKSHDLICRDGDYMYYDTYLGGDRFAGEEALWIKDIPYWSMNYAGRVIGDHFSGDFLKEALFHVPEEKPYRGPQDYENGEYAYHCDVDGSFDWFQGKETIEYQGKLIYECYFHGGLIQ